MKLKVGFTAVAALTVACSVAMNPSANAAGSIRLEPAAPIEIEVGDNVSLNLLMDFTGDATLGGGIDFHFDSDVLEFVEFTPNPSFPHDTAFLRQPDRRAGGVLNSLAFGNFAGISAGQVGVLTFKGAAPGTSPVDPFMDGRPGDSDSVAGPFFSAVTFSQQDVEFTGAVITVVPEPEAWALLVAGLGLIGWRMRTRSH